MLLDEELINLFYEFELDINSEQPIFYIATKSFVVLFIPIIPYETVIYYKQDDNSYTELFYPVGKGKVLWEHVKQSYSFYIFPAIITALILNHIIGMII